MIKDELIAFVDDSVIVISEERHKGVTIRKGESSVSALVFLLFDLIIVLSSSATKRLQELIKQNCVNFKDRLRDLGLSTSQVDFNFIDIGRDRGIVRFGQRQQVDYFNGV